MPLLTVRAKYLFVIGILKDSGVSLLQNKKAPRLLSGLFINMCANQIIQQPLQKESLLKLLCEA